MQTMKFSVKFAQIFSCNFRDSINVFGNRNYLLCDPASACIIENKLLSINEQSSLKYTFRVVRQCVAENWSRRSKNELSNVIFASTFQEVKRA